MTEQLLRNPGRVTTSPAQFDSSRAPLAFHRTIPGYAPTPLIDAPALAEALGIGRVSVKLESDRFGLPAFKMLGASWAVYRALSERLGSARAPSNFEAFAGAVARLKPLTLIAATDGNHGRAVARMAKLLGLSSHIFIPADMAAARVAAIETEGAAVTRVNGTYDDAVAASARAQGERSMVISDTSWDGYEAIPRTVIAGYATIFCEVDDQLAASRLGQPDVVMLPAGVGALAAAGVSHYRPGIRPVLVSVEPADAACVLESCRAGALVEVPGPHRSCMVGLNCGSASLIAFPALRDGLDWCLAVADGRAERAMRMLAAEGIVAGETGSASLAGAVAVIELGGRDLVGLTADASLLVIVTEGATDPINYERVVGRRP